MRKVSYTEQLKHPKWQKRRLEVLNDRGFKCEECGGTEVTLHVHHKSYRKGADAWDYELSNFVVLCADCHKSDHEKHEAFNKMLASLSLFEFDAVFSLVVGYLLEQYSEAAVEAEPYSVAAPQESAGFIASIISGNYGMKQIETVNRFFTTVDPDQACLHLESVIGKTKKGTGHGESSS